jgi:hypothetical protein
MESQVEVFCLGNREKPRIIDREDFVDPCGDLYKRVDHSVQGGYFPSIGELAE